MKMVYWISAVNIFPILALISVVIRPARPAIPWLGLATVVAGTAIAFSSADTLCSDRSIGARIGWLTTTIYGSIGLGIVVAYVQFRPVPFVPLGAIVAGGIHIASFYAYLPPMAADIPGMLPFAAPGFLLVAYGAYLWYRCGLAESMENKAPILRLSLSIVIVAGLVALIFLQLGGPRHSKWFAYPPDLTRIVNGSELVIEGVVTNKNSFKYRSKMGKTLRHTLYEIEVANYWRGTGPERSNIAVQDFSPVDLSLGEPYLVFSDGLVNSEQLSGYWQVVEPQTVWTVCTDGDFYPYPGLPSETPLTRDSLARLLGSKSYSSE